jgi:phosphoribosyl 1,2-cyclic phosphodiesterase
MVNILNLWYNDAQRPHQENHMEEGFVVRFRGVRGNYCTPGAKTLEYGGNTACVEVWAGGRLIILDAGTGVVSLGDDLSAWHRKEKRPIVATVFFSHTHHDHTQGFPFFSPAYIATSTLYMFGPRTFDQDLEDALARAMLPPTFPVQLDELASFKIISTINQREVVLIGPENEPQIRNLYRDAIDVDADYVRVHALRSPFHPPGSGTSIYRIEWKGKSAVYASDTEGVENGNTSLIEFARGCDLLIHDAQYTEEEYIQMPRQGWGHSTPEMATLVAQKAEVKQLVLFHHDPHHDDDKLDEMEAHSRKLFPNTTMAREGLTIRL